MSCKVNLQGLAPLVFEDVLTHGDVGTNRTSGHAFSSLTFPKSKSALWDPTPVGDTAGVHLCYYRNPQLRVLEKALRLAHRHARQSNTAKFGCFLLGSVSVDEDEEGVTVTLDRFDPGRDQPGTPVKVSSASVPGDVVVPVVFVLQGERNQPVLHTPADITTFKNLHKACSGGEPVDLARLLYIRGQVSCCQQGDQLGFSVRWRALTCSNGFDVVGVRAIPVIPTALARNLGGRSSSAQPGHGLKHQRGYLTMDHTRKLLLLLESDPKSSSLPLVGVWLSGILHVSNPQVWAWCLQFLHSSALQDRVLSERGCFLVVLFSLTRSQTQFFQCQTAGMEPGQLDYQLLSGSQELSLYQHVQVKEGSYLQCDLSLDETRQTDLVPCHLSISEQDSGVEDEDLSPRPSPSPHPPTQQTRRVQPSVPELSLLVEASPYPPSHTCLPSPTKDLQTCLPSPTKDLQTCLPSPTKDLQTCLPSPTKAAVEASSFSMVAAPPSGLSLRRANMTFSPSGTPGPGPGPGYLHSTPSSQFNQPCVCCWSRCTQPGQRDCCPRWPHTQAAALQTPQQAPGFVPGDPPPPCSCPQQGPQSRGPTGASVLPSDAYQVLMAQERQLRLVQAQIQVLLEAQVKPLPVNRQTDDRPPSPPKLPPTTSSVAVGTGASLFWRSPEFWGSPVLSPCGAEAPRDCSSSRGLDPSTRGLDPSTLLGRDTREEHPSSPANISFASSCEKLLSASCCSESPVLGESASMLFNAPPDLEDVLPTLQRQVNSRLQASPNDRLLASNDHVEPRSRRSLSLAGSQSSSSSSSCSDSRARPNRKRVDSDGSCVQRATLKHLQQLGVCLETLDRPKHSTVETASTLACINPAAVLPRLSLAGSCSTSLLPGATVELSLEANGIDLRYRSDTQLSRLSLSSQNSKAALCSPEKGVMSSSNMSLATRGYMKRYGLMEEEEEERQEEDHTCQSSIPQGQLMGDLRPKMQHRVRSTVTRDADKENSHVWEPLVQRHLGPPPQGRRHLGPPPQGQRHLDPPPQGQRHLDPPPQGSQGSVGNFLDVSRLRQLPKLF